MERTAPCDGLNFYVTVTKPAGGQADSLKLWDGSPWQWTWFPNAIADLKACRFPRFTENFLRIDASPGTLDWAEDQGWSNLAEKLAICAWVAREGDARGICLDLDPLCGDRSDRRGTQGIQDLDQQLHRCGPKLE